MGVGEFKRESALTKEQNRIKELEAENQRLKSELEVLDAANEALAQENVKIRDFYEGLEAENENLKAALRAVAQQLRVGAEGIDEALKRIEGFELN